VLKTVKEETDHLSEDEVRAQIEALTMPELIKIEKMSQLYGGRDVDPGDLLQEAIKRALDGTRKCKRGVDFLVFLKNAMRSIASAKRKKQVPENDIAFSKDAHSGDISGMPTSSPEENVLAQERAKACEAKLQEIYDLFKDDGDATGILMGKEEGLSAQEIREMWGMDKTTYNSTRRRIRRTVNKKYPKGWSA
jgi:RNA polymerase sigma-70 factor (ECF subfamily)